MQLREKAVVQTPVRVTTLPLQQMQQINVLIGSALTSETVLQRVLVFDATLQQEYNLSDDTWQLLESLHVPDVQTFCQRIISSLESW